MPSGSFINVSRNHCFQYIQTEVSVLSFFFLVFLFFPSLFHFLTYVQSLEFTLRIMDSDQFLLRLITPFFYEEATTETIA